MQKNIKKARKVFREKEEVFGVNVIKKGPVKVNDPAGQAIQKILIDRHDKKRILEKNHVNSVWRRK